MHTRPTISVAADPCENRDLLKVAARLAVDLNLPFIERPEDGDATYRLVATPRRLELRITGDKGRPFSVDLSQIDVTSPAGRSLKQPLVKALGIRKRSDPPPVIIDATAGWGEDSWLMASFGCRVLSVERNKVVATLLRDGLFRAGASLPDMLQRVHVVTTDARHMLRRIHLREPGDDLPASMEVFFHPDVVYLDPMFPSGRKTAERKPLKILRELVGDDEDGGELFDFAMRVARSRVVVKRSPKADPVGGKPTVSYEGKGVRYDVYAIAALKPQR